MAYFVQITDRGNLIQLNVDQICSVEQYPQEKRLVANMSDGKYHDIGENDIGRFRGALEAATRSGISASDE